MSDEQNTEIPASSFPGDDNPHAAEFAVLEALKAEVESLKDQRLRALAEVENVRRRADKENKEASQYAVTKFARDMLGIADNFARALADGKFDPNLHQAIAEVPGGGKPPGTIVDVMQTGFMIGDRLLRPAMVTVARRGDPIPDSVDTKV